MGESRRLSTLAYAYVGICIAAAVAATIVAFLVDRGIGDPWAFVALTAGAAVAQLYVVHAPEWLGYDISLAFVFAAVMLLPATAVVAVTALMFLPVWARERFPWYMSLFNISNYALPALAAMLVLAPGPTEPGLEWAGYVAAACVVFTLINHVLLALVLRLARGESLRDTRLFTPAYFSMDGLVLCSGAAIAELWRVAPVTSIFAMLPLILILRALKIPQLEKQSWTDAKTGLYNSGFFFERGAEWCERASAGRGTIALAMMDLDFLRETNNRHGHLAGDAVITAVGEIIKSGARASDMAARFGGEEFALLMPDTTLEGAVVVAERIRQAIEEVEVEVMGQPVHTTISIGIAAGPGTLQELIARADAALYRAKDLGRNQVLLADLPEDEVADLEPRRTRATESPATLT
jgi:diguanylate cyclase (GGDEF)-like protein